KCHPIPICLAWVSCNLARQRYIPFPKLLKPKADKVLAKDRGRCWLTRWILEPSLTTSPRICTESVGKSANWNSTDVYSRIDGQWKIIHGHWSLIKPEIKQDTKQPDA